jgi:hypothetical protein
MQTTSNVRLRHIQVYRSKVVLLQEWHLAEYHELLYSWRCVCGHKAEFRFDEMDQLREGERMYFLGILSKIDEHRCGSDLEMPMGIFYRILAQVNQAFVEELVDDTMLRFSLLELK